MRVAITGAAGLLGAHLAAALQGSADVVGLDRHPWWGDRPLAMLPLDLADEVAAQEAIARIRPAVLFHCAALVNVDECERSPERAFAANAEMPRRVAQAAGPHCLVVYITTDGVFRGDQPLLGEGAPPEPRTVYGRSKLAGEAAVAAAAPEHLIVRTNFFGWSSRRKPTSAEWLYDALAAGDPLTLFDDFFFSPIYVVDLVDALLEAIDRGARGLYHLTGGERISKYAFGMELARQAGFATTSVRRGSIDDAGLAASRPKDMSLDTSRAAALLGRPMPGAREGIQRFLADRGTALSARASRGRRGSRGA